MNPVLDTITTGSSVPEAIEARRSIRAYHPEAVPESDISEILRLASLAPSGNNLQPWRFIVVTNSQLRAQLSEAGHNQRQYATAPVVIAVVADAEDMLASLPETAHPNMQHDPAALERYMNGTKARFERLSQDQRIANASEQAVYAIAYLTLAAQALGYNTSVMGGFDQDKAKAALNVPAHARIVTLITLGKGAEAGFEHHRHPLERITTWLR